MPQDPLRGIQAAGGDVVQCTPLSARRRRTERFRESSVLTGLAWLSEDEGPPLDNLDRARTNMKQTGCSVGAELAPSNAEIDLLDPLGFEEVPPVISMETGRRDARHCVQRSSHPRPIARPSWPRPRDWPAPSNGPISRFRRSAYVKARVDSDNSRRTLTRCRRLCVCMGSTESRADVRRARWHGHTTAAGTVTCRD